MWILLTLIWSKWMKSISIELFPTVATQTESVCVFLNTFIEYFMLWTWMLFINWIHNYNHFRITNVSGLWVEVEAPTRRTCKLHRKALANKKIQIQTIFPVRRQC